MCNHFTITRTHQYQLEVETRKHGSLTSVDFWVTIPTARNPTRVRKAQLNLNDESLNRLIAALSVSAVEA